MTIAPLEVPLCVDLDGTLTRHDTLIEAVRALARTKPLALLGLPLWLAGGKARLKREITKRVILDVSRLPWNEPFLEWLRSERARGRSLWLVTAADRAIADAVAAHLGLFDGVLASDGRTNLKREAKARALEERFPQGFDYAGNSRPDLAIWRKARSAVVVNASQRLVRKARAVALVARVFA